MLCHWHLDVFIIIITSFYGCIFLHLRGSSSCWTQSVALELFEGNFRIGLGLSGWFRVTEGYPCNDCGVRLGTRRYDLHIYLHILTYAYESLHILHMHKYTYIYLHILTCTYIYLHIPTYTYVYLHVDLFRFAVVFCGLLWRFSFILYIIEIHVRSAALPVHC